MNKLLLAILVIVLSFGNLFASQKDDSELKISKETTSCLNCHKAFTPGIVSDWMSSRHAKTTPSATMKKPELERRISVSVVEDKLEDYVVGCYECHSRNTDKHKDSFDHFGHRINVVVTPNDCSTCHPVEVKEYSGTKKANAIGILTKNPVYHTLVNTIIGMKNYNGTNITIAPPSDFTRAEACFGCHGMELKIKGLKKIKTPLGMIDVPDIENWPSQGVGRLNPDGSLGSCSSCHPRHSFSIEIARSPYTCAQCHLEPDVPAWNVYAESKHGNIYFAMKESFDMNAVPWKVGTDFKAPTCASCHNSLIAAPNGNVLAERTHDFGARLWVRVFGLIYTHPQPKNGDTSIIKNKDGLPLPTTFSGEPASEYLIDKAEQQKRFDKMKAVCTACHSNNWVDNHFQRFHNTVKETDEMTLQATKLMLKGWEVGAADNKNPFDEYLEQKWIKQWLFYANTVRYASAMTGAYDYAAFKYGWWDMTYNLNDMKHLIDTAEKMKVYK